MIGNPAKTAWIWPFAAKLGILHYYFANSLYATSSAIMPCMESYCQNIMIELLTNAEMAQADRRTIAGGVPGIELMEHAGARRRRRRVAHARAWGRVIVVAGPGNNGGDGFVAARLLAERGYAVRVMLVGECARAQGRRRACGQAVEGAGRRGPTGRPRGGRRLIIDALFGAGLDRPVEGLPRAMIEAMNAQPAPIIAVDLPSGVNGTSGAVMGTAVNAAQTVTFFRKKPGHLLLPGRLHCGSDLGRRHRHSGSVLTAIAPQTFENSPALWRAHFPVPRDESGINTIAGTRSSSLDRPGRRAPRGLRPAEPCGRERDWSRSPARARRLPSMLHRIWR